MVAILAGLATALISFPVDYYYGYLVKSQDGIFFYSLSSVLLVGIVIAGLLSYLIVKALDQTGVTKLFRPASQKTTTTYKGN